jgi:neutral ceramidase
MTANSLCVVAVAIIILIVPGCTSGPDGQHHEALLQAGEGVADITPPLGTELGGFHRSPGKERRVSGIRQPSSVRAIVLTDGKTEVSLVSLDVLAVSLEFCRKVQDLVARRTGIPGANIHLTATHTHSMPTLRFCRQWGRLPNDYMELVGNRVLEAVELAKKDLAPAELRIGKERVVGANLNRTSKVWKNDDQFTKESTDDERWLDTMLHALYFVRQKPKGNLLWYQFSAHSVCFRDEKAGPDWSGLVAEKMNKRDGLSPSFLQGHCGDVDPPLDAEKVSEAVTTALHQAVEHARPVTVGEIRQVSMDFEIPLDVELVKGDLEKYRKTPEKCTGGWVDAEFAREYVEAASAWDLNKTRYAAPMTALRLGNVAVVLHPGELYSYYGLAIRRDSPFRDTIVVGYTDDLIGYLPDPNAYKGREYSAIVVPKILDLPPFTPDATRQLMAAALALLRKL